MKTRAEMIDWLSHQYTDGRNYVAFDSRIKDNEKAIVREYWKWHDKFAKFSTAKLRSRVANLIINKTI